LGKISSGTVHLRLDGESVIKTDTATVRNILEQTLPAMMAER
jgi:hypothetical protein